MSHRYLPFILALVAIVLVLPSLWSGLLIDDYFHRLILQDGAFFVRYHTAPLSMFDFADGNPERARELMDLGFFPWWTLENIRLKFLRPATVFTHWLDYQLWPDTFCPHASP